METKKMAAQFLYIYILAKAYINTTIYMSVYLKKTHLKFCLWKRAWGGLQPVRFCEVVEERLCEIRWTAVVPDVAHNTLSDLR